MKGLYVIRYKNSIEYIDKHNKNHIIERSTENTNLVSQYIWYYGFIPMEVNNTYCTDEIHSVLNACFEGHKMLYGLPLLYVFKRLFAKDKYEVSMLCSDSFYSRGDIHIKEENILNIKTVAYAELLDYSKYSFFELSKKLSADDFMDFCRDHNISLVNIFGGK